MKRRPMVIVSAAIIVAMLGLSIWAYAVLPADARVPIHWGPEGAPDGYADKVLGLFLLPLIAIGVATLLAVIPSVEPRRANLERSSKAYGATWVGVMVLFGGLHLLAVAVVMGAALDMTRLVMVGTGVLLVVIGNYLPKVRPNYLMGIRTPWTLTSDLAWTRTHRLAGRLFVVVGLVVAVAALIGVSGPALVVVLIAGILLVIVAAFAVSYVVWRDDPERGTA